MLCYSRIRTLKSDQLDGSNLDHSNQSGPDLKICSQSEAVPSGQLRRFSDIASRSYHNGSHYLVPPKDSVSGRQPDRLGAADICVTGARAHEPGVLELLSVALTTPSRALSILPA
ncbi:hypothetical protein EVAR_65257_1 [Eumeta japonica]|uniref:Uncharacterized protein n=1 Tax=Eumeta variegata TaxID=151549 RepID=A0A4C2A1Y6_EUMVA|nr:hypothetical protein EVAR_65257_1 [Eumeta japonica]